MSKTAERIGEAWREGKAREINNTRTDGESVFLFENKIIEKSPDPWVTHWTLAGWETRTTIDRLNGILDLGLHIKAGEVYLRTGKVVDPYQWYIVTWEEAQEIRRIL